MLVDATAANSQLLSLARAGCSCVLVLQKQTVGLVLFRRELSVSCFFYDTLLVNLFRASTS